MSAKGNPVDYHEGDVVRATMQILEEGLGGTPRKNAEPCTPGWVHAEKGEYGQVMHVEPGRGGSGEEAKSRLDLNLGMALFVVY